MDTNRRDILRKMTAVPVGITAFTTTSTASVTDDNGKKWKFEEVEGKEQHNIINQFTSDSNISILRQYARKQSWSLNLSEAQVIKTISPNTTFFL
jgi:tRNA(Leu) C34 or U34 (ribose-2'-O)-methylase TrmL